MAGRKRKRHATHTVLCLNRAARLARPWSGTERGCWQDEEKKEPPQTRPQKSQKTCPGPQQNGQITQTNPGTERGGVGRTKHAGTPTNPAQQTQQTFPGPQQNGQITETPGTERGGGRQGKTRRNTPKQPKRLRKRQNQLTRKKTDLGTQKNGKLSGAATVRKSAVHGCASRFIYVTLDPPCKRAR